MNTTHYILLAGALVCALAVYLYHQTNSLKDIKLTLLREALHGFRQYRYIFICVALQDAAEGGSDDYRDALTDLYRHILHHVGTSYAQYWANRGSNGDFHAGRILWIEQMITAVENNEPLPPPPIPPEFPNA